MISSTHSCFPPSPKNRMNAAQKITSQNFHTTGSVLWAADSETRMSVALFVLLTVSFLDFCKDFLCVLCLLRVPAEEEGGQLTAEAQRTRRPSFKNLRVLCASAVSSFRLRLRRAVFVVIDPHVRC